ncbi:MAG: NAD-dependent epimerase/dehydratase family protein [Lachnospiraceae bacterium]|nr:NAD-dependent epimerase/dehydratase family protein [Lachnospiraceae bacterium]
MVLKEDLERIVRDSNIDWERLRGARVLVTGATGFIGSLCMRTLLATKIPMQTVAMVRNRAKAELLFGDSVEYLVGDVREPLPSEKPFDFIIHCASNTNSKMMVEKPVDTLEISAAGTMRILECAKECGAKSVVYVSSMEVYGITEERQNPVTENVLGYIDVLNPRSSYSEGKRVSECLCAAFFNQYQVPVKIARLALTMGPGLPLTDNRVSMQFARSAIEGRDIVLHTKGQTVSNFCYVTDCIRGIFTVLLNGASGEAYNVCNDAETRTIREIAELVSAEIAGGAIRVVYDIQQNNEFGYAPDVVLRLCSDKLRKLGWNPEVSMSEAYSRLIRYIQESNE